MEKLFAAKCTQYSSIEYPLLFRHIIWRLYHTESIWFAHWILTDWFNSTSSFTLCPSHMNNISNEVVIARIIYIFRMRAQSRLESQIGKMSCKCTKTENWFHERISFRLNIRISTQNLIRKYNFLIENS